MPEQITIKNIGRKEQASKFREGETYKITTVLDEKGRKLSATGQWAENWKIGDTVDVEIEEKKWTDKDGFENTSLNLKNPNQKQFTPRGGGGAQVSPVIIAYQLAAQLAPLFFSDKKKIKLEDVDKLAEELKKRIDSSTPTETQKEEKKDTTPDINVDDVKEEKKDTDLDSDDDDEPF